MSNESTIHGTPVPSGGTPPDPDLCRVSGYLVDIGASACKARNIYIVNQGTPFGVGTDAFVLKEKTRVTSDSTGFLSFDVMQGSTILVEIPGLGTILKFLVTVPEQSTIDLLDLLMPYVVSIEWDQDDPLELAEGERTQLTATGTLSNGETTSVTVAISIESDDESIVLVTELTTICGYAVGTALIEMTEFDSEMLTLNTQIDGTAISRLNTPDTVLPAALTVNVV